MEPVYLVQKGEYVAIACEGPTGSIYLVDGSSRTTLFTKKRQSEFTLIPWNRETATKIAIEHNSKFKELVIDLSKL